MTSVCAAQSTLHDHFSTAKSMNCCNFVEGIGPICGIFMVQIFEQKFGISWLCTVFKNKWLWTEIVILGENGPEKLGWTLCCEVVLPWHHLSLYYEITENNSEHLKQNWYVSDFLSEEYIMTFRLGLKLAYTFSLKIPWENVVLNYVVFTSCNWQWKEKFPLCLAFMPSC